MLLSKLTIKNFRGIENLEIEMDDVCVLIGENNSGKSTVLDAIRLCLTRSLTRRGSVFDEYDYHLKDGSAVPSKANPIEITLRFDERRDDEWSDEISQLLAEAEQVDGTSARRSITLYVKSEYDAASEDFSTSYDFLDLAGNPLIKARSPKTIINLQHLVPTFYLASLRDAAQEFRARSQFWGPFVRSLELSDEEASELESALADLNKRVLDKHTAFATVKSRLQQTAQLVPLGEGETVSIDAVPSKIFDILSRTQVNLAAKTGAKIPIVKHGNGTQSLAVICLFDAFLESQLEAGYGENAEPLLALEEPEAHLHPSAVVSVGGMLSKLSGQKIISSHSGDLLAGVKIENIRRLRRKDGSVCVHRVDTEVFTNEDLGKLDYKVRATRGSLLFSRCWLLVEGETEATLVPECARAVGIDLVSEGITCIEYSQVGVEKYIKLADQLGIDWIVLADGDQAGNAYVASAKAQINGRSEAKHIFQLPNANMEVFLCLSGFGNVYCNNMAEQKKASVVATAGTEEYWLQVTKALSKNAKPRCALEVSLQISNKKVQVPEFLANLIAQARELARSAA